MVMGTTVGNCLHCGARGLIGGCVVPTICDNCRATGHKEGLCRKCQEELHSKIQALVQQAQSDVSRDIDSKFATTTDGGIVKKSNGEIVPLDEPLFLLRARDHLALALLRIYRVLSQQDGCNNYHFVNLDNAIAKFQDFAKDHPERMKQPSDTRGA